MKNKEIYLSEEEQLYLKSIVYAGIHNSHEITRARVLLLLDRSGKSDHVRYKRTAERTGISVQAVYNMRDEFLQNHDVEAYLMPTEQRQFYQSTTNQAIFLSECKKKA